MTELIEQSSQDKNKKKGLLSWISGQVRGNDRFFWTSFWLIITLIVLQIPLIIAYYENRVLLSPALLWSFGYLMLGILAGFVFAVPTILNNNSAQSQVNPSNQQGGNSANAVTTDARSSVSTASSGGSQISRRQIAQANTNLTQISDWLTKILVGASLTQLNKIPSFIKKASIAMAKGLAADPKYFDYAAVYSGGIIMLFFNIRIYTRLSNNADNPYWHFRR